MAVAAVLGTAFALSALGPAAPARAAADTTALKSCGGCHDLTAAKKKKMGPPLFGLYGTKTKATWDEKTLDKFLADPASVDPGSKMKMKIKAADKRKAMIEALKALK
jgi:cytochrome c2